MKGLIRQELKSPALWACLAIALALWPLALELTPLASSLSSNNARDLAYDVAYVLATLGAVFGGWKLSRLEWLFGRTTSARKEGTWFSWVTLASFIPASISLLPWITFSGASSSTGLLSILLVCMHLSALTLVMKSLGFSKRERSLALVLLAVGLRAALHGESGQLLLASRVLEPTAGAALHDINLPLFTAQALSILGLTSLSALVRTWRRSA